MKKSYNFYRKNQNYSDFLERQDSSSFKKVVDIINKYSTEKSKILDYGCGTGVLLKKIPIKQNTGVDISETSIKITKQKGLKAISYNGDRLPFRNKIFDIVVSYNVLEHVDNVVKYLDEGLRVLKGDGIMVLSCPNFLSITNNYHWHTRGLLRKATNIFIIVKKLLVKNYRFDKMPTVKNEHIKPDDDACNITNFVDIYKWIKAKKIILIYSSSQPTYKEGCFINILDRTPLKFVFGSCFLVLKKK